MVIYQTRWFNGKPMPMFKLLLHLIVDQVLAGLDSSSKFEQILGLTCSNLLEPAQPC